MNRCRRAVAALLALCLSSVAGCAEVPAGLSDAGRTDAGQSDAAALDASSIDDAGARDASARTDASASCELPPACDASPPAYPPMTSWRHRVGALFTTSQGAARHRGRDLVLRETDAQWAIGKFAYGLADDDLEDEDVDVFLLRDCAGPWEQLGFGTTTNDGTTPHATVERIEDDGGRLYFEIPAASRLGPGRHRIHFVVRGDHSSADMYIDVLAGGERYAISDVDGTLTESETAEWLTVLSGPSAAVQPHAPEALWALHARNVRIFYITARPDWLTSRTHAWVRERGLPPGLVHTTLGGTGATGAPAIAFKTEELLELEERIGGAPILCIGNTDSDAAAFRNAGVDAPHRYLYQLSGDAMGGVIFTDYATLETEFAALPLTCP